MDFFICVGELSGDLHGAQLIEDLLKLRPQLSIGAVAGPKMRELPIQPFFRMEDLQVMGFIDVFLALPKLIRQFFSIRNQILKLNPKAVVFIDYPGLHLRMQQSLRKKGYKGKLIHFPCPSVWAWGKKWIPKMADALDLLLAFFPFEKECFAHTKLPVQCIGHPIQAAVSAFTPSDKWKGKKILGIFPGSRQKEIDRNLSLQLKVAKELKSLDPTLCICVSEAQKGLLPKIPDVEMVSSENRYELMRASHLALATSGTVTLELALHKTPTVVHFAIKALDCWIAQKILKIQLPFYSLPNLALQKLIFPELFGPHFNEEKLFFWAQKLWFDEEARAACQRGCDELCKSLEGHGSEGAGAKVILSTLYP